MESALLGRLVEPTLDPKNYVAGDFGYFANDKGNLYGMTPNGALINFAALKLTNDSDVVAKPNVLTILVGTAADGSVWKGHLHFGVWRPA
jgi:hypothetical protein